jgi:uncharacterized membrane protein
VTWTLASMLLLALALGGLLAWYERTRPPSRVVALIATLAALAALGRVAFAPLPNVKPTTDIVAIAGFVLGPVPGAVVGALGALSSNLVFGQGPWTPWQMLGWGLCGLLGGWLGIVTARRAGRWTLAIFCAALGLLYGLLLDTSMWIMYSAHSLEEWVVTNVRAIPFNIAHAAGNLVFALVFAPVLVRALTRFRERLDVRWLAAPAAVGLAFALAPVDDARAASPQGYLLGAQNRDGGLGTARGRASDALNSAWAAMGLAAAGRHPARVRRPGGRSLADRIGADARRVRDTGDIERTILALRASGRSAAALARRLQARQRRDGSWEGLINRTSFGVLALRAAGRSGRATPLRRAARFLERSQNRDGGWGVTRGGRSGVDDTAAVVQALVVVRGRRAAAVQRGVRFLLRRQNPDGGFGASGGGSNAQSTAWAAQGLVAAGRTITRVRRGGSRDPLSYLRSLQQRDGSIRYSRRSAQTPVWVTAQALTALARDPFPIAAPR